jgi:tRNA 2-thiocytidine biosynthesis protein TtcA
MVPGSSKKNEIEKSIIKRFRREIWHPFVQALKVYKMISPGDRIAVCISGGKDSFLLAKCMQEIQAHGEMDFDLEFLVMDPGYRKENRELIRENAGLMGVPIRMENSDIFASVTRIEHSPCYLCARMRRGFLYARAKELGCNKIALGHHLNDVVETVLLSVLYTGQFNTMMPKLKSENFPGMELIRPLYFVREEDIIAWRDENALRFLNCACRFTEQAEAEQGTGAGEGLSKRAEVKKLIAELKKTNPSVEKNIMKSAENVNLSACLGYVKDGRRYGFEENYEGNGSAQHGIRKAAAAGKHRKSAKQPAKITAGKKKSVRGNHADGKEESYVYLLRCGDGSFYCGYTNNLEKRFQAHCAGRGAKYTRTHRPLELVYHETFQTKSEALKREYAVKQLTHAQKEKLIRNRDGGKTGKKKPKPSGNAGIH